MIALSSRGLAVAVADRGYQAARKRGSIGLKRFFFLSYSAI